LSSFDDAIIEVDVEAVEVDAEVEVEEAVCLS
jgi:hypothetical protein